MSNTHPPVDDDAIAIIGMAAHLPGAASAAAFWDNLRAGRSAIRRLSEQELRDAGESGARMRRRNYVPFAAPLDGFADFDPDLFGFSPKEAAILDPQHRQFLEVAWEAFEDAGHPPRGEKGKVGVFAGCGMGSYFYFNLCSNPQLVDDVGMFLLRHTGNDKDFLATRVSHILDLHGPSVSVQTACSTSLVAVHYAAEALLTGDCDMALAGGVTVELPQNRGYLYHDNEILSPDGACHAFDHRAQGTVFGSGAGAVVLRRLADAVADGDRVIAVVKGSAINNDGAQKAGYLAPSVDGQARAIAAAHKVAGVAPESISYVECHGTGTYLGDPIEVAALTQAFATARTGFCRIGSVKTNIGHLDTSAGVASLIKAAQALQHRELPPSLGFEAPNPAIDFDSTPFRVNDRLTDWTGDAPLRAGVNSLGVGGTNAHVVLEEAPAPVPSDDSDWPFQILTLSARSKAALADASERLAQHLCDHPDQKLADVAFTLQTGRTALEQRRVLVADSHADAAAQLAQADPRRVFTHTALDRPDTVFMFPGGGAQYAGMARDLYDTEPVFAEWMDRGLDHLQPKLDYDLRALWLPEPGQEPAADAALTRPSVQLPLIMITEYALAQMFMSWGVQPAALVGHSMGENTAACLAGVMTFEDCIGLVHLRGQLFDTVPAGGMLSVPLSRDALQPYLDAEHDIASVNAPELIVVSGPQAALDRLQARLAADAIEAARVAIDIAAHSRMLDPILKDFGDYLRSIPLHAPRLPIISNRTGQELTAAQATDPDYWVQHLRHTVRFADCITTLGAQPNRIYLEMGPGRALASLARMHDAVAGQQVLSALRHPDEPIADDRHHLSVLGRIWALGGEFDWRQIWGDARRQRVALPGYPFQRARYFIAPRTAPAAAATPELERLDAIADWGTQLAWKPAYAACEIDVAQELGTDPQTWLIFADADGTAAPVIARLRGAGHRVVTVAAGDAFARHADDAFTVAPENGAEDYPRLLSDLAASGLVPTRIAHFWLVTQAERFRPGSSFHDRNVEQGFYALTYLVQALQGEQLTGPVHMTVVTNGAQALATEVLRHPEKAMIAGPARVAPREVPGLSCATLDIDASASVDMLLEELCATPDTTTAILRDGRRYARRLRPAPLPDRLPAMPQGAHWVITGGFGGIGLSVAETLIRQYGARITLIARTALPDRADWADRVARHGAADPVARRIMAVQRLEALGGQVHVAAADVCNIDQMAAALDAARGAHGAPHGVVHAAGQIADAPLMAKTTADIADVLSPKVHGMRVLDTLLPDGAVPVMVLFASTSTLTAPAGQVDYVAANEYLNAVAQARRGGQTRVLALDWGIWAEAGMAADAMARRLGQTPGAPAAPCAQPLYDEMGLDPQGHRRLTARLDSTAWVVDEHRTRDGTAILPGTAYMDLAAQALRAQGTDGPFELRDMHFIRALAVPDGTTRTLRATLEDTTDGCDFTVRSDVVQDGRDGHVLNAQGRVATLDPAARPAAITPDAIAARCPTPLADTGPAGPQAGHLAFGPRWQVLGRAGLGAGEGLAQLALPDDAAPDLQAGHVLHPALADLATGWAMALIPGYDGTDLWVPVSYDRVRVWAALPQKIVSHARLRDDGATGEAAFDVTIAAPDGDVIAEITRFAIRRIAEGGLAAAAPMRAAEITRDPVADTALSPAEERLRDMLALGITPSEGGQAFLRVLAANVSPIVVSSVAPDALIAQIEADTADTTAQMAEEGFARPELDSAYVAPRNDVERTLTGFWQELLGIDGIGVEDNFFDLGGHSLIAVRLFARIRKTYGADFPISALFEAPTIAACATLIAEQTGISLDGAAGDTVVELPARRRFKHIVPMHEGGDGRRPPFFLVAGMFGNVLNLRHLAALVGRDRPFYGLQARGLYGGEAPHDRIEDAAADYIAELRAVQPHGPYCLGGFSGGGITAFEMARQLDAAGEAVEIVVLLDTPLPVRPRLTAADRALIKLAELRRKGPRYLVEWWRARADWKRRLAEGPAADSADAFHDAAIEAAFRTAVARYTPQRWNGRVVLFRPPLDRHWKVTGGHWVSRAREYVYPDNDWTRHAPQLQVIEVPGDHDSMVLEPSVRVLADRLRALLPEAPRAQEAAE